MSESSNKELFAIAVRYRYIYNKNHLHVNRREWCSGRIRDRQSKSPEFKPHLGTFFFFLLIRSSDLVHVNLFFLQFLSPINKYYYTITFHGCRISSHWTTS